MRIDCMAANKLLWAENQELRRRIAEVQEHYYYGTRPVYALNTQVRYQPAWRQTDYCECWRVVGMQIVAMLGLPVQVGYFIQPWELSGTWMLDRPIKVWESELTPWKGK